MYVVGSYIAPHTTRLQSDYIVITKTHKYTYYTAQYTMQPPRLYSDYTVSDYTVYNVTT